MAPLWALELNIWNHAHVCCSPCSDGCGVCNDERVEKLLFAGDWFHPFASLPPRLDAKQKPQPSCSCLMLTSSFLCSDNPDRGPIVQCQMIFLFIFSCCHASSLTAALCSAYSLGWLSLSETDPNYTQHATCSDLISVSEAPRLDSSVTFLNDFWALFASLYFFFRLFRRLHKRSAFRVHCFSWSSIYPSRSSFLIFFRWTEVYWSINYLTGNGTGSQTESWCHKECPASSRGRDEEADWRSGKSSLPPFGTAFYWPLLRVICSGGIYPLHPQPDFLQVLHPDRVWANYLLVLFSSRLQAPNYQKQRNLSGSTVLPQRNNLSSRMIL
jgi:hypothetical protein